MWSALATVSLALAQISSEGASPLVVPRPAIDPAAQKFAAQLLRAIQVIETNHAHPAARAEHVRWAIEGIYRELKEPVPSELLERMRLLNPKHNMELGLFLLDFRSLLASPRELSEERDLQAAVNAILSNLERGKQENEGSRYLRAAELQSFNHRRLHDDVGLKLAADAKTGYLRVITPIYRGPAYKAGLRGGDLITELRFSFDFDGLPLDQTVVHSTLGMSVERAESLMLSQPRWNIRVVVYR